MAAPTLCTPGSLAGALGQANPHTSPIDYLVARLRAKLPGFSRPPQAMSDRVWVVRSETGSGKSTVLPAALYRVLHGRSKAATTITGPGVICTQPRVITAVSLARGMAANPSYPELVLGVTVGYFTGVINEKPPQGLIYATSGALRAQIATRDSDVAIMEKYRFIVVDEAHESSLESALLLNELKGLVRRNLGDPRTPFILLASATFEPAKYAEYFDIGPENIMEVVGRSFPIETRWASESVVNYPQAAADAALEVHRSNDDDPLAGDILIFMPGAAEIEATVQALTEANQAHLDPGGPTPPYVVLALSRAEVEAEGVDFRRLQVPVNQLQIPDAEGRLRTPSRKIIVSTVVAETGLTLPALKYVIDCGWHRQVETYYPWGCSGLVTRPAPKSRIRQRMGRVGRLFPGVFIALYTRETFEALDEDQPSDIVIQGVGAHFAMLAQQTAQENGGVFRVGDIDLLDPPPVDALAAAIDYALVSGYLEARPADGGHVLTPIGKIAAACPLLGARGVQTLLSSYLWGAAASDAVFLAVLFEAPMAAPPFYLDNRAFTSPDGAVAAGYPAALRQPGESAKTVASRARGDLADDFLEGLLAFEGFAIAAETMGPAEVAEWCMKNGLDYEKTVQTAAARQRLLTEILAAGLNPFWGHDHRLAASTTVAEFGHRKRQLKRCLYAGLQQNLLERVAGEYRGRHGELVSTPPAIQGLDQSALPKYLVTNQVHIRKIPQSSALELRYQLVPGMVSVVDGALPVDKAAALPQSDQPGYVHANAESAPRDRLEAAYSLLAALEGAA